MQDAHFLLCRMNVDIDVLRLHCEIHVHPRLSAAWQILAIDRIKRFLQIRVIDKSIVHKENERFLFRRMVCVRNQTVERESKLLTIRARYIEQFLGHGLTVQLADVLNLARANVCRYFAHALSQSLAVERHTAIVHCILGDYVHDSLILFVVVLERLLSRHNIVEQILHRNRGALHSGGRLRFCRLSGLLGHKMTVLVERFERAFRIRCHRGNTHVRNMRNRCQSLATKPVCLQLG